VVGGKWKKLSYWMWAIELKALYQELFVKKIYRHSFARNKFLKWAVPEEFTLVLMAQTTPFFSD
jgi:hypothetical protein